MTNDVLRFLLGILTVFLGGGTVQLIIALIRRRAELRQLNTAADVNTSTVTDTLIKRLQEDGVVYREQVKEYIAKVERLEARYEQAQRDFAAQLQDAHNENTRLVTRIAQLQTDLDIANRQIADLRQRISP